MPGHPRPSCCEGCEDVDARHKAGHDEHKGGIAGWANARTWRRATMVRWQLGARFSVGRLRLAHPMNYARRLLLIDLRNRLLAAGLAHGEGDPVAGVHVVQQAPRGLELLVGGAAAIGADGAVLGLP